MTDQSIPTRRWLLVGIVCGLLACATYVIATQVDLPTLAAYLIFMSFGPFLCAAMLGVYHFVRAHRDSIALQLGVLFLILSGAINTTMAAMQGAVVITFRGLPHDESVAETGRVAWQMGLHSGNAIQLGADMAFDVFILTGLILFGIAVLGHPRFGKAFGWTAIVIGAGGLVLNAWTFPEPPASAGLIDGGPLVGLWFFVLTIQMIRVLRLDVMAASQPVAS